MTRSLAGAYSASGPAWQAGPAKVYDPLADALLAAVPSPLAGARLLDLGAGTGAVSRAAQRRGAAVVAVDVAVGMLAVDAARRPPSVVGDAATLPFAAGSFDVVAAGCSLNHLADPGAALREAARVVRRGGFVVASAYAADDHHPVKEAVEAAVLEAGWSPPDWLEALRRDAVPQLATVERAKAAVAGAGLRAVVHHERVVLAGLGADDLVEWRLGMAQVAPFVSSLPADRRASVRARARQLLGEPPPLVRSVIVVVVTT